MSACLRGRLMRRVVQGGSLVLMVGQARAVRHANSPEWRSRQAAPVQGRDFAIAVPIPHFATVSAPCLHTALLPSLPIPRLRLQVSVNVHELVRVQQRMAEVGQRRQPCRLVGGAVVVVSRREQLLCMSGRSKASKSGKRRLRRASTDTDRPG